MIDLLRCALPKESDPKLAAASRKPWIVDQAMLGLQEARRMPSHATPHLARWFRKNRKLGSRDRRIVGEIIHGVIRHEALLLRIGARSPAELIARWADMMDGDRFDSANSTSDAEDYATALNIPGSVAQEWLHVLGPEEAASYAQALSTRPATQIRVNLLLTDRKTLAAALLEEDIETECVDGVDTALTLKGRANLMGTDAFKKGLFEVQDSSSQRFCNALPIKPGQHVLDLCAGAGGKSLALAARGAHVSAYDIRDNALRELVERATRAKAAIVIDTPKPSPVVIVDAPCSGSGRLRRNPALRWGLTDATHLETQRELLDAAASLVLPGGLLAYATCSVLNRENQHTPEGSEWTLIESKTLWPHRDHSDGFFWAFWKRD
ncbi:MAG: RsmB/NOP family class I SAM-dependent RNA methyltransferase [Myxococcota bacterium]